MARSASLLFAGLLLAAGLLACTFPGRAMARQLPGIDANKATEVELDAISGIGPALAARIVTERRNGPFESLEDLQQRVRGVGPASLKRMQEAGLTVGGASAASRAETIVGGRQAATVHSGSRPVRREAARAKAAPLKARPVVNALPGPARPTGP
jgi:competence protein ComEA